MPKIVVFVNMMAMVLSATGNNDDLPCLARQIPYQSVVCVCNENYCDTITRVLPIKGTYVAYTSSEDGLRFSKSSGTLEAYDSASNCCQTAIELDPRTLYQTIEGFGGAVTDAAGINWKNITEILQIHLVNSYFSDKGLEYNMIRVPIGGSDFSTHAYAYNELPENDTTLSNFSLSDEDYKYKIPLIQSCMNVSKPAVHLVATTWSPPAWMKSNRKLTGLSHLKPEFLQTYADYHYKFIQKYSDVGIPIWAITTTNEPSTGALSFNTFNNLGWSAKYMGKWIVNNLGPTIRNSTFKDVKILAADDQRLTLPYWFNYMVLSNPKTLEYIDGVAVHYYTDFITPATILSEISKAYPDKFVIATEACEGSMPWQRKKVELGSWQRAKNYISDIITDLNHNVVGWIEWNLCLNAQGGPNWAGNYVDSPTIVYPEKREFIKQPTFYAIGHFSKFIPRGSRRIKVTENKSLLSTTIENVAFLTPNDTVVAVFYNSDVKEGMIMYYKGERDSAISYTLSNVTSYAYAFGHARKVRIRLGDQQAVLNMGPKSVTTIELFYEAK